jgi:hypothetical protein
MGGFICSCDEIREETGAHVAIVHHNGTNSNKKGRGHTSLEGAADAMVLVEKHSDGNTAKVTKNKDDEDGWKVGFRLDVVEVGIDEDGGTIKSCAVVPADVEATNTKRCLTGDKATAMDALYDVLGSGNVESFRNRHGIPDAAPCVRVEAWRQEFYARAADKPSQDAKQKAFKRAMAGLRDAGYIAFRDDFVWSIN